MKGIVMKVNMSVKAGKINLFVYVLCVVFVSGLLVPLRAESPHLKLGNPSGATADESKKDNFLMEKEFFALSYNNTKGTPNWVSWHLTKAEIGNAPRFPFHPDEDLPDGFRRILPKDYTG